MPTAPSTIRAPRFFFIATLAVCVVALYFAAEVLRPITLAALLSFLLAPFVKLLEHWRLPRAAAVLVTVFLAFLVIGFVGYLMYGQLADLANRLPGYKDNITTKISSIRSGLGHGPFSKVGVVFSEISSQVTTAPTGQIQPQPVVVEPTRAPALSPWTRVMGFIDYLSPLTRAGLVILLVVFMLFERDTLRDRVIRLAGHSRVHLTTTTLEDAGYRVSRYLVAQTLVNAAYATAVATGLFFIGVPNAILWGLFCGLLRFLPYIGPWLGAAMPVVLSFAVFPGYWHLIATISLFVVLEMLTSSFLEPIFFGARTGITPLAILIGAVFWTWIWGPLGLLMATPLTVCLVVLGKHVPSMNFLNVLLSDEEVLAPHYRIYQRLIAENPEEAEDVLEEYTKEGKPPAGIYQDLLLPALILAENDLHEGKLPRERYHQAMQIVRDIIAAEEAKVESPSVLCLPARDEADEVASMLFAQVLVQMDVPARHMTQQSLASEMLDEIQQLPPDAVVVISSLPPRAFAHARYLVKRIRARWPEQKVVVGLWNSKLDLTKVARRMKNAGTELVATDFAQAAQIVRQLAQPEGSPTPRRGDPEYPGTKEHPVAEKHKDVGTQMNADERR